MKYAIYESIIFKVVKHYLSLYKEKKMKYDFDKRVDRAHGVGSYSMKWAEGERAAAMYGDKNATGLPEDRIPLFLADMDFECAPELKAALQKVVDHGIWGYSGANEDYGKAVARWEKDRFGIEISPKNVRYYAGCHPAIVDAIKKLTKEGDGVIVPCPTYYYKNDITSVGRHYTTFQMINNEGYYTFDWEKFEALCQDPQNTMAIFQQPHNPTGRCWTVEEIEKIGKICRENNVIMLSDDLHQDLKRKETVVTPFVKVLGNKGIINITGISKTFNAAGLAVANMYTEDEELNEKLGPVAVPFLSPFGIAACIACYTECDAWVDALNEYLDKSIDHVVERLHKEMPKLTVCKPEATYILWLDFTKYGLTSEEVNARIGGQAHLALSDGAGMDTPKGTVFRRMCCTSPIAVMDEAIDRLVKAFADVQ